jgi:hypothetical protein
LSIDVIDQVAGAVLLRTGLCVRESAEPHALAAAI